MKTRFHLFQLYLLGMLFSLLILSCHVHNNANSKEFIDLKASLFDKSNKNYKLPIYADPPTADYEDIKKEKFLFEIDSLQIEKIVKYKHELEPFVLQYLDSGFTWIYLAAFLKYDSAVDKIKDKLLTCNRFYGWEGPDYSKIESYIIDDIQYCYQMAYISAIEYISDKSIDKAISLSKEELNVLKNNAMQCVDPNEEHIETYCSSYWLLKKMKLQ